MSLNPEDQARQVAIQIEKQRLIAEREEDALLIAAGKPPIVRPDIPEERTAAASLARAELAEEDAERAEMLAELERNEASSQREGGQGCRRSSNLRSHGCPPGSDGRPSSRFRPIQFQTIQFQTIRPFRCLYAPI